jgi:hypothetical protein
MAQPVLSPNTATGTEDRQGCYGASAGGLSVLDDAAGMGLSAVGRVRFAGSKAQPKLLKKQNRLMWLS